MEWRRVAACTCAGIALAGSWPSLPCEKCQKAALRELMMPWRPDDLPKADPRYLWQGVSAITIQASGSGNDQRFGAAGQILPDGMTFVAGNEQRFGLEQSLPDVMFAATVDGRTYYAPTDPAMNRAPKVFPAMLRGCGSVLSFRCPCELS